VLATRCFKSNFSNAINVVLDFLVAAFYIVVLFRYLPESASPWKITTANCVSIVMCAWVMHMVVSALVSIVKIKNKIVEIWRAKFRPKIVPISSNSLPTGDINKVPKDIHYPQNT